MQGRFVRGTTLIMAISHLFSVYNGNIPATFNRTPVELSMTLD